MVLLLRQEINRLRDELFKVDVKFREQEVVWGRKMDAHTGKFKDKEKRFEEIVTRCVTEKETECARLKNQIDVALNEVIDKEQSMGGLVEDHMRMGLEVEELRKENDRCLSEIAGESRAAHAHRRPLCMHTCS